MIAQWIPKHERSTMGAIVIAGKALSDIRLQCGFAWSYSIFAFRFAIWNFCVNDIDWCVGQ